ncbi:hypothetical protein CVT25_006625 [Psilocybe cyanescens]|uniref:Uncharacterized protein n=1 Tax=Psilocybe cyanescens TaxID=93625 RepID=A0A409XIR4_PSICY|nr:hypothetical protein CVT25_006625 [Psilocybe cyanescens]
MHLLKAALHDSARLDYPIELYTDSELEKYALRILAAYDGWKDSSPPYASRQITHKDGIVHFYLSDSGRWLFLFTLYGAVVYHDLDNPGVPARLLVHWMLSAYPLRLDFAVDVDDKAPALTFNLALYLYHPMGLHHFQIWRVRLHTQSEPYTGYFTAEKLASFPRDSNGAVFCISLRDRHIAYAVLPNQAVTPYIAIIDWKRTGLDQKPYDFSYRKRVIFPARQPINPSERTRLRFHLLPRNQLFVVYGAMVVLYDFLKEKEIRNVLPIPCYGPTPFPARNSIHLGDRLNIETLSKPFFCPTSNSIRLTICSCPTLNIGDLAVLGIVIPQMVPAPASAPPSSDRSENETENAQAQPTPSSDRSANEPELLWSLLLLQEHNLQLDSDPAVARREMDTLNVCFGYNKAIVRAEKRRFVALTYKWFDDDDDSLPPGDVYKHVYQRVDRTLPPVLNELSGRVAELNGAGHLDVYEFSSFMANTTRNTRR